ncbi:protein kinase domain-containing protein [Ditylenchus destructor]|nr:protein kinase domain-containing protein [Ditylenchus destructor]
MSAYNIGTDANSVPISDSQFPTGSKLAQYLHGGHQAPGKDFSRPPPSIPAPPFRMTGQTEVESSIGFPFSQMNLSGGAPTVAPASAMDGSDEDRVTAFLNGNYSATHEYFPPEPIVSEGEVDTYQSCSSTAYYAYQGLPSHVWKSRIKNQPVSSFFINPALKADLIARQLSLQCPSTSESFPNVPVQVEQYFNLIPLDNGAPHPGGPSAGTQPSLCDAAVTYKALKSTDGLMYCLKRVPATRPFSQKQILACENWKRLSHSNMIQLKEVFQTRSFGDHSFVFVYDFHPLAETVRTFHFGKEQQQHNMTIPKNQSGQSCAGGSGLPENLVWNYVIQISSAIRYIHSCGLAIRFLDISKLLISEKSRLLLAMCGMEDVLQADNSRNMVAQQACEVFNDREV